MTNEELSNKILNDIQYIKQNSEIFQKKLVDFKVDEDQRKKIRSVLNYFRTADFNFIKNINNQEGLLNLENIFSPYKISIEAFLTTATKQRLDNFITHNTEVYEYMRNIINIMNEEFIPKNQEDETDERIQLKSKILDDINFLNSNSEKIQTLAREDFDEKSGLYDIDRIFYFTRSVTNSYLDKCTNSQLHAFYALSSFRFSADAYSNNRYNSNVKTSFINSIKPAITFIENLQNINVLTDDEVIIKQNDLQTSDIKQEIQNIKNSINDLQSSDAQIEITKIITQANQLFEKASHSEKLLDEKIQTLINTSEKQVAYTLSEQFEKKTNSLKRPIWSYLILIISLPIYMSYESMDFIELLLKPTSNEIYWHSIFMLFLTKLPIIFLILFVLNEYTKAKKLFEEYEHKRIMAATLVNNLERLKNELHADEKDLLELIKAPFEKIFDNPVHSIYGDKSGDKNLGIDQLEKVASILEKLKPKTP